MLEGVQAVVNQRMSEMATKMDATLEHLRIGAIKGQILDADGSAVIYDLFTEFGVTAYTEIDFDLDNASPAPGAVKKKCHDVRRKIEDELGAAPYDHIHAICGADFFYQAQLIRELAVRHVTNWAGVEFGGGPAPPTLENIAAVMDLYPVGERFFQEFTLRQVLLNAAKNGSGLSAAGTSSRAEGPSTAKPAKKKDFLAPEANSAPTEVSAPTGSTR